MKHTNIESRRDKIRNECENTRNRELGETGKEGWKGDEDRGRKKEGKIYRE